MPNPSTPLQSQLKALRVVYGSLLAAQAMFLVVVVGLVQTRQVAISVPAELDYLLQFVVPALNIVVIGLSYLLFTQRLTRARRMNNLALKIQGYQIATVIRCAMLEGTAIFNLIIYLQTGRAYYLLFFVGIVLLYLSKRPILRTVINDLGLDNREVDVIRGTN